ncbi:Uncharacterised protein [Bordetella pertussis]|nr:Uncharacterised protein [Bordetella pertussis]
MAAFSIGTRRDSLPREITKPPGCCDRWRGKPISVSASSAHWRATREAGSRPQAASERSISFLPFHHWCARATASMMPLSTPSARPVSRSTLRGRYEMTTAVRAARWRPYFS